MIGLSARIQVVRAGWSLDVALALPAGRVLALLGPNGAGKSTVLAALAGLLPLTAGHITLDGEVLDDPSAGRLVAAADRRVGMVFQDYLLFPHLSVLENVAFGLRARGAPRREAQVEAMRWLERVGLTDVARALPGRISGGQAQRVALARALAPSPAVLLLDEPLAALDARTRLEVRTDLRRHLADYPGCSVLVTHDPLDAMVLADELVVIEDGKVVQRGAPVQVARSPRTQYVARLVGLNLFRGSGPVFMAFAPSAVALHRHRPQQSAGHLWPGVVTGMEQHADSIRVEVQLRAAPSVLADVTAAQVAGLGLGLGSDVWAAVQEADVRVYPV